MKKILIGAVVMLAFCSQTFAQTTQYACPNISRTLYAGTRGEDVRQLQAFLYQYHNYPNGNATGYFGFVTYGLVQKFQRQNGILSSGIVGNLTRAKIASVCQGTPVPGPVMCTKIYKPVCGSTNGIPKTYGNQCEMTNAGAQYMYEGECTVSNPTTTPNNCKVWYDGCNTCSRGYVGGPLACTLMYCFAQNTPYCKEYFSSNPEPVFCTADAKLCPNGQYVGRTGPNCQFVCP